ncbi:MAG TPA: FecR domain-containing protein [Polyangiaceae bacterium]|nr:FecR domain-containing protein [Polyangiaceae bacterium]
MSPEPKPDAIVERMVFLARQLGTQAPASYRERQFVATLSERVAVRRTPSTRRRQFAALAVIAAACLAPLLWFGLRAEQRLSYQVSGGSISEGSIVGQAGTSIAFSDGSRLKLTNGARARIDEVTAHGARVDLVDGEVAVDIVKAEGNAWFVQAGPYEVHVIGTAFDVRWTKERRRIEVDLHRGTVVVTGPRIDGQLRLQSGQRLTSTPDEPSTITRTELTAAAAPVSATSASPKAAPEPGAASDAEAVADLSAAGVERRDPAAAGPTGWPHLVAQGDFERVLAAAHKRGIDSVLSSGTQAELSALADAARYGRNTQLARRTLLAERKRFPGAAAARGAAFFLGGIEPDGSAAALTWYETYLAESPRGPYASQALGRRMMIVPRQGGSAASAPLAREYLQRFAQGPYASAAHKILERSSE